MTPTPDLHRLNDAERRVLALLARGHTAKSIAADTGCSEGSVNERLREARRKTGVGSSRELARLLSAQENRDEQSGVASPAAPAPAPGSAPPRARWQGKALLMTIPIIAVAMAAIALHAPASAPQASPSTSGDGDVDVAAAQVQRSYIGEARDARWADGAEAVLRRRYLDIRGVDGSALRIACRTSLCAVSGRSAPGLAVTPGRRAAEELASPALRDSLAGQGLHADVTSSSARGVTVEEREKEYQFDFIAYWRRTRS